MEGIDRRFCTWSWTFTWTSDLGRLSGYRSEVLRYQWLAFVNSFAFLGRGRRCTIISSECRSRSSDHRLAYDLILNECSASSLNIEGKETHNNSKDHDFVDKTDNREFTLKLSWVRKTTGSFQHI